MITGVRGSVLGGYSVTLTKFRRFTLHLETKGDGSQDLNIGFEGLAAHSVDRKLFRPTLEAIREVPLDQLLENEWPDVQRCLDGGEWPTPVPSRREEACANAVQLQLRAFEITSGTHRVGWVICKSVAKLGRRNG